jgi:hypothetical protein
MMINIAQSQETFAQRSTKKNSLRSWDICAAQYKKELFAELEYISYDD